MRPALPDEFMAFISPDNLRKRGYQWQDMHIIYMICEGYLTAGFEYHWKRRTELIGFEEEKAKEA